MLHPIRAKATTYREKRRESDAKRDQFMMRCLNYNGNGFKYQVHVTGGGVSSKSTLQHAIENLDQTAWQICLVTDQEGRLEEPR